MFAVLDGKGKTLMLIIPDLQGMAHSVLTVLNQREKQVLGMWQVGPGLWLVLIWLPGPENTSAAPAGLPGHHR